MQNEFIEFLKLKLNNETDFKNLAKKVGYKNLELGAKRVAKLKDMDLLGLNTQEKYYFDGEFGARQIITELLYIFNASDTIIDTANHTIDDIFKHKQIQKIHLTLKIKTDFVFKGLQTKSHLYLAHRLNIVLPIRLNSLPYDAKINRVLKIAKLHYAKNKTIEPFGKITGYELIFNFNKSDVFYFSISDLQQAQQ